MKRYVLTVLGISWILTVLIFLDPKTALTNAAFIMFVPAIVTLFFIRSDKKKSGEKTIILRKPFNRKAILFGIFYPVCFICICAVIAIFFNLGTFVMNESFSDFLIGLILNIFFGFFLALGEEYGWRGYLLPNLTKKYNKQTAVIFTGIVWSLYHLPVLYLSAHLTEIGNPLAVCLIQAGVVFFSNFAFSFCYYLSESIVPVIVFHSIWNALNPAILGSIYDGTQGFIEGNILIINGEGLVGLLVSVCFSFYFWKMLKYRT